MIDRRRFLGRLAGAGAAALAGAAGALGLAPRRAGAEPPPETATLRLAKLPANYCHAPQYFAADLLRAEGFTDVRYVPKTSTADITAALSSGEVDVNMHFAGPCLVAQDGGAPIVTLAGVHVGCFELFAGPAVRSIRDLRGKTVGSGGPRTSQHVFLSAMLTHVGVDPRRDVAWVTRPAPEQIELLAAGKIDAMLAFPPDPLRLRERKIGRMIVSSTVDRPWSQYFCCMLNGNRDFVARHPVAVKRALRAILKAAQVCASDPARVARELAGRGFVPSEDDSVRTIRELPYDRWSRYDPEDTMRFYALRLHEGGLIKSPPNKLIAQHTDWRALRELRRELRV